MNVVDVIIEGHHVGRGLVGRIIGRWTFGQYKHISGYFVFDDGSLRGFQSNSKHGCHFFEVQKGRGQLDEFTIPKRTPEQYQRMYERALELDGRGYDGRGIYGLVVRARRENPDKFFCSELWADLLANGDVILLNLPHYKISPVLVCASTVITKR